MIQTYSTFQLLAYRTKPGNLRTYMYIIGIDDNTEKDIQNEKTVFFKDEKQNFVIKPNDVILFGNIDLSHNSDDSNYVLDCNWINDMPFGIRIPSNYDYEHNSITKVDNVIKYYDTRNPLEILKYKHGLIGKPDKVLIFEQTKKYVDKYKNLYD